MLGPADQAWFDRLRRQHFPPERNQLAAHLTMFHHLPPSSADELHQRIAQETRRAPRPEATVSGLISLGRGVAYRIESAALAAIRARLAEAFRGSLTPQDEAGWRPHVTVQNKVAPAEARALLATLNASFEPRPVEIAGIATWWYRGGPWEALRTYRFAP